MKNILLVSHSDFPANSAVHVHHFANELTKLGFDCVVAVPHNKNSISSLTGNLYKVTQYDEIEQIKTLFNNQQGPDLVHAWTPREHVRIYCNALAAEYEFKLVVHLEDSEESVIQRYLNLSLEEILQGNEHLIPYNLSHPRKYQEFLATADGSTVIIDSLTKFIPESVATITVFPGVDTNQFYPRPHPQNSELVASLNIPDHATILCYTGNVHLANQEEVRCLYLAVGKRNLAGKPTILIRTGIDNNLQFLAKDELWVKQYSIELGWVNLAEIPNILALADILVQPGRADDFNDYRFPSKIPEFLAMGKPVILPATNIGHHLQHLENALILPVVDQETLPEAIDFLMDNPDLKEKIAKGGIEFAHTHLNWRNSAEKLVNFYETLFAPEKQINSLNNALQRVKYHLQDRENQENEELVTLQSTLQISQNQLKELQNQNHDFKTKIDHLKAEIRGMRTSKFWKIRDKWFKLKNLIGVHSN
jgi:glycosyltransferase involved in cell wall biosynthesis